MTTNTIALKKLGRGAARLALAICMLMLSAAPLAQAAEPCAESKLFVTLPEICPTPDGMAMDGEGNIIVACPNYADQTHPAVLMRIDKENNVRLLGTVPPMLETGVACPMGIAFGPGDKELFVCDNQGWMKPNNKGRLLCMKFRDGRPTGDCEVVAYGMSHPNGVRVHDGHLYVTQSMLIKEGNEPLVSGVYRFALGDRNIRVNNTLDDPNLLVSFKTLNLDCQYGADGIVFDSKGNLYIGNFGDGAIHKVAFNADGSVASSAVFAKDTSVMRTTDGICVDAEDNIYVADFSSNAVCMVTPDAKIRLLAKSPDCDGSEGGLDQPGEPIVRGSDLLVTNFDLVTGPDKVNSGHDRPYTMSVIDLKQVK